MFRFKNSILVDYNTQGYIYFTSRMYHRLNRKHQEKICRLCKEAGGEYHKALFEFVTSDAGATAVCMKHFLSQSTLERIVRKYYTLFANSI